MDEFLGVVKPFSGSFVPKGYMLCDGTVLEVSKNNALFSILGTNYGGNGMTTFALPDLRGAVPVGVGTSPKNTSFVLGQTGGTAQVTLLASNLPAHTHEISESLSRPANTDGANTTSPQNSFPSITEQNQYYPTANAYMSIGDKVNVSIQNAGRSQPMDIRSPYTAMNYIICVNGLYPARG